MKLWTPGRFRIAKPHVCGRCGGLRREWLREHRRRAGLMMLAACCCTDECEGSCLTSVDLTVSGIDAALCDQCITLGPDSVKFRDLAVDGTYNVPFLDEFDSSCESDETVCRYLDQGNVTGVFGKEDVWRDNTNCSGSVDETGDIDTLDFFVTIRKVDCEIEMVRVNGRSTARSTAINSISFFCASAQNPQSGDELLCGFLCNATFTYGDSVPNDHSCLNDKQIASNGGTAIVSRP